MNFTNPVWLWALTGLAIPVGIHLLSRKEGKTIFIGSLRYLIESPTAQFRHIRLNEIALLILRCLLTVLFVFLLAGILFHGNKYGNKKWLVIEKGIEHSVRYKPLMDKLSQEGFELRFLSPEFPLVEDSSKVKPLTDYWASVEKLDALQLDSIIVISYTYARNFSGERIPLPEHLSWLPDESEPQQFNAMEISFGKDSVWNKVAYTSSSVTKFETEKTGKNSLPQSSATPADTIAFFIFADKEFSYDKLIIEATLAAIQEITPHKIITSSAIDTSLVSSDSSWLIWLSNKKLPETIKRTIAFADCGENQSLLIKTGEGSLPCTKPSGADWMISRRLREDIALKENFALRLAEVILPKENNDLKYDSRVFPEREMWSSNKFPVKISSSDSTDDTAYNILAIVLILMLIGERTLAYQRKQ
jgi:hypothetical protein